MSFDVACFSERGPRKANEDAVLAEQSADGAWLLAVADGLGGHFGGAEASSLAIRYLSQRTLENLRAFHEAFSEIHEAILERQAAEPSLKGMATTLTALKITGTTVIGAHCGDTRCVLQRGSGIRKITVEHSEARRLLEAGKITKEEYATYPRRNILDSALGVQSGLRVDQITFDALPGDHIVLTSDGVHEKVKLREMLQILLHCKSAEAASAHIKSETIARIPEDNFSAVCAFVR